MGRGRRNGRKYTPKVRTGLPPRKKLRCCRLGVTIPPKLRSITQSKETEWNEDDTLLKNYQKFGLASDPNILSSPCRIAMITADESLQLTIPNHIRSPSPEQSHLDSGSDLEDDDLKSILGKRRKDGKCALLQPLTNMQRVYVGRLIEKYGNDYEHMFRDRKLNEMQHSVATLRKLCERYKVKQKALIRPLR